MATQSLPAIATTDPPLWSIIDCQKVDGPYVHNTNNKDSAPFCIIWDRNDEVEVRVKDGRMDVGACAYAANNSRRRVLHVTSCMSRCSHVTYYCIHSKLEHLRPVLYYVTLAYTEGSPCLFSLLPLPSWQEGKLTSHYSAAPSAHATPHGSTTNSFAWTGMILP